MVSVYRPLIIFLIILCFVLLLNIFDGGNEEFVDDFKYSFEKNAINFNESKISMLDLGRKNEILSVINSDVKFYQIIPPFIPITIRDRIRVSNKYKLLSCSLHKHLSSMISPSMCYLKDEAEYIKKYGNVIAENQNACRDSGDFHHNIVEVTKNINIEDWVFFSLSRDPIERFISGFSNICIDILNMEQRALCYNCGSNLSCFITTLYKDVLNYSKQNKIINYFIAAHFFPQNWMCDYFQYFSKFVIIPYSSNRKKKQQFLNDFKNVLIKANVPEESQNFIISKFNYTQTIHSTVNSASRQATVKMLYESPKLVEILYKIFYYDFILFNYSIPKQYLPKEPPAETLNEYRLK
uniref:Sulfotransferase domain-containing protein n=2 Tax=Strongyloides stercoralis TaxID=6248 RepID=A0AAF5CVK9_STRER